MAEKKEKQHVSDNARLIYTIIKLNVSICKMIKEMLTWTACIQFQTGFAMAKTVFAVIRSDAQIARSAA